MRRFVALTALACLFTAPLLASQAAPPPAQKSKFVPPVQGLATLEVIQLPSKRVGKDMVSVARIRNTSKGSINLLIVDEYWYDANLKIVAANVYRHRKAPIQPGEIIEVTIKTPWNAQMQRNHLLFRHANGKAEAKTVKAFK